MHTVPTATFAELGYLPATDTQPVQYAFPPPAGTPWENVGYDRRRVAVQDARAGSAAASLHVQGFELWEAPSRVQDWHDADELRRVQYAEAAELALAATGGRRAFVFDHLLRRRGPERKPLDFGHGAREGFAPVNGRIHNDYTERSGQRRLALVLTEPRERLAIRRYCIVNLWRSIAGPVLDTPLAVCDARTVSSLDLVEGEVRYPKRIGEIYLARYAPRHRWYYYPAMQRTEVLVFKQYDSQLSGPARFTPHAAFDHPEAPAHAPSRESLELRCLVVME